MAKILLVEDDSFIADIYKKKFESSGFEVLNITNGRAVLKAVEDQRFDIILLDLVIPEMSGLEVLKELRGPSYPADLPIVVFSNLSNPEDRELAVELGANGFIPKTEFSPSQVVDEVNRYLRQFGEQGKNESRRLASETLPQSPEHATGEKKRILFIEDEEVFVDMFVRKLEDEGYEVVVERAAPEALERIEHEQGLDLIVTDAMLPGMSGKDLIAAMREAHKASPVPIFVISASLDEEDMDALLLAGATKVLLKTKIVPSQLADHVTEFFREHESN